MQLGVPPISPSCNLPLTGSFCFCLLLSLLFNYLLNLLFMPACLNLHLTFRSTLFLANIGKVVYPAYMIDRPTPVFHSRDNLIAFADAYQQKHEMFMALESNRFEQAYSYYPEASKKFDNILAKLKDDSKIPASILPEHLRCFTAEWAITKICYFGVEVLQKWRRYDDAVNQLESLLRQDVFCFDSRGRWYDRLALNLHQHLKRPKQVSNKVIT